MSDEDNIHIFKKPIIKNLLKKQVYAIPDNKIQNKLHYLGKNQKHIVILVNEKEKDFLCQADIALLRKILSAVKLSEDDIALINLAKAPGLNFVIIKEQAKAETLICFGIEPALIRLNIELPTYNLITFNAIQMLFADSLSDISKDDEKKRMLWNVFKKLFL